MDDPSAQPIDPDWWKDGVLYQVYPRSFMDANGDGIGDLAGITQRLDHLEWLGIDGIWSSPITVSPNADWGYDVADFCDVDPALGTLADLDHLVAEAHARGIQIVLDLVPNHTSIEHPWFEAASVSKDDPKRDWYVWADPAPDGGPPNNWVSTFTGPAWTLDYRTGQYFLHNFLAEQPDLNWWNDEVRDEFDRILRFWFDRGVMGFRIDVVYMVIKDLLLRDNPPAAESDHLMVRLRGQRPEFNSDRPEVHDVIRRWRAVAEEYDPPRVLIGETHVFEESKLASYYGDNDELHLGFNFLFIHADFDPDELRDIVEKTDAAIGERGWPVWTAGNHDNHRFPTRWCGNDPARTRLAMLLIMTLRGTPFLYYGDEIGMPDTDVARDQLLDPVGIDLWPIPAGRDPERTPMPWSASAGGGFTGPGVEPWLPFGDLLAANVEAQRNDPSSMLHLTRDLIEARRKSPDLRRGAYRTVPSPPATWVFARGEATLVALNFGTATVTIPGVSGRVVIGTDRARDGAVVSGDLVLGPSEGLVVALG